MVHSLLLDSLADTLCLRESWHKEILLIFFLDCSWNSLVVVPLFFFLPFLTHMLWLCICSSFFIFVFTFYSLPLDRPVEHFSTLFLDQVILHHLLFSTPINLLLIDSCLLMAAFTASDVFVWFSVHRLLFFEAQVCSVWFVPATLAYACK